MKLHEYQAKALLQRFGVAVPEGRVCATVDEAVAAYAALGRGTVVVKAQIHAGGRGKGGGIQVCKSLEESCVAAQKILGMQLVTHQTGPAGQKVRRVWVERGSAVDKELYVGIAIDRTQQLPVLMASSEGGMDIEQVAAQTPEKILKAAFSPQKGLSQAEARRLAQGIGIPEKLRDAGAACMVALAKAFVELDCSLAEINPLVTTRDGALLALDAKLNLDDNALYRHEDLRALRDRDEEDPRDVAASEHELNYIALDGTIGCMVNGAGLAMATMDVIQLYGESPANFLDVGGGANTTQVTAAFKLLLGDPQVKAVLVNIFGGIMKCDVVAEGIVSAARQVDLHVPLVVRLEGTNVEKGRALLQASGLPLVTATDLDDAAKKVCAAVQKRSKR